MTGQIRLTSPWTTVYWDNERTHQIREIQAFRYPAGDSGRRVSMIRLRVSVGCSAQGTWSAA
jgi:hypothetical protein